MPVVCDSSQESEVKSLFEQVDREQHGRLDVLVNNAYAGVQVTFALDPIGHSPKPTLESLPLFVLPLSSPSHFPALGSPCQSPPCLLGDPEHRQ